MKSLFSKGWALLLAAVSSNALALDFKAVDAPVAILYDAPSTKGKRLFLLPRYTPVEMLVSVGGFIKVREPEGALGWIEKKDITDQRTLVVTAPMAQIRLAADEGADLVFEAVTGLALKLVDPPREGWAKVRHVDGPEGYVRVTQVWGL